MGNDQELQGSPCRSPAVPRRGLVPREAYGLAVLLGAVISGYFLFRYSGPYRWVADAMVALFHTNVVNISYLLCLLLVAAPLCGAVYAAERRYGTRETWFTPIFHDLDYVLDQPPGKLIMVGSVLVVLGGYFAVKDLATGPLSALSVRALEDGRPSPGRYVELTDGAVVESARITFRSNSTTYRYLPVVDHAERPVLFLRLSGSAAVRDADGRIRGILDEGAIEGELQGQLRARSALGDRHFVLGVGRRPEPMVGIWIGVAGLVALAVAFVWLRARYLRPLASSAALPPRGTEGRP